MKNTNEHTPLEDTTSFDPIILLLDVAKRWLLILLVAVMAGVGTYILQDATYEPVYKTTTTFVVTTQDSASTVYSNLTSASTLATVFSDLLNSTLLRKVILEHAELSGFNGTIQASAIPETNLLTMTVTASDPRSAFLMAQGIITHHGELTGQIVDDIVLEVLQRPSVPTAPSNASNAIGQMKRMALLAAAGWFGWNHWYNVLMSDVEAQPGADEAHHAHVEKGGRVAAQGKVVGGDLTGGSHDLPHTGKGGASVGHNKCRHHKTHRYKSEEQLQKLAFFHSG